MAISQVLQPIRIVEKVDNSRTLALQRVNENWMKPTKECLHKPFSMVIFAILKQIKDSSYKIDRLSWHIKYIPIGFVRDDTAPALTSGFINHAICAMKE